MNKQITACLQFALLAAALTACNLPGMDAIPGAPTLTQAPIESPTPEPTPTEIVPLVALVNDEGIHQASFDASLAEFQAAQQQFDNLLEPGQTAEQRVLDALIDRALLAQAARANGYLVDVNMVAGRVAQLTEKAGGADAMNAWLEAKGYTLTDFMFELKLEMEAAWQRQQIVDSVPEAAEQVRARQVLFYDEFLAARAYNQISAGTPFDTIVQNNDPQNLGYLGWFPRGVLPFPELEQVAFSLQPLQFSSVIQTAAGYHIIQVFESDPNHPLSAENRLTLQEQALAAWLAQQRSQSQVDIYNH